jgi:dethiobiotin synthase
MTLAADAPILVVTGTDTGVGKTIASAALVCALAAVPRVGLGSLRVAVDKPTQTGVVPGEPGDIDEVARLSGVSSVTEGIRLQAPMAPVAAATRESATLPTLDAHMERIRRLARSHDRVVVEGAGGLLVKIDGLGHTLADLTAAFAPGAAVIVVCRSGLGTLNHTELTLEALRTRGIPVAGLVIGSWPVDPSEVELDNRGYLSSLRVPLLGAIPQGASQLSPEAFREMAPGWLSLGV